MSLTTAGMSTTIDLVDAAQQREDLLEVARRDHLGHLDARRREQDVDARRVAPQHVGAGPTPAIRSVGRSRIDGASIGHLEQRAQVAELEAAVDEHGPLAQLADGDREVERERRLADAALRARRPRRSAVVPIGDVARELLVDLLRCRVIRSKPVNGIDEHAVDAVASGRRSTGCCGHGQDDDRDVELGLRGSARRA